MQAWGLHVLPNPYMHSAPHSAPLVCRANGSRPCPDGRNDVLSGSLSVYTLARGLDKVGVMFSKTDGRAARASETQLIQHLQEGRPMPSPDPGSGTGADGSRRGAGVFVGDQGTRGRRDRRIVVRDAQDDVLRPTSPRRLVTETARRRGLDPYSLNIVLADFAGTFDPDIMLAWHSADPPPSVYLPGEDELFVRGMWWMLRQRWRLQACKRGHRIVGHRKRRKTVVRQMKWDAMASGYFAGIRRRDALRCKFQKAKTGAVTLSLGREASLLLGVVYRRCQQASPSSQRSKEEVPSGTTTNCPLITAPAAWTRAEDRVILEATKGKGNACHVTFAGVSRALGNRTEEEVESRYNALLAVYLGMRKEERREEERAWRKL